MKNHHFQYRTSSLQHSYSLDSTIGNTIEFTPKSGQGVTPWLLVVVQMPKVTCDRARGGDKRTECCLATTILNRAGEWEYYARTRKRFRAAYKGRATLQSYYNRIVWVRS
jgi:hypothetical protein